MLELGRHKKADHGYLVPLVHFQLLIQYRYISKACSLNGLISYTNARLARLA